MKLESYHYRQLKHMRDVYGVYGWESYNDTIGELEEAGYVHGSWMGSLEYDPRPMWQITEVGKTAMNEYTGCKTDSFHSVSPHRCKHNTMFCTVEHT